jgi:hypothetical protein
MHVQNHLQATDRDWLATCELVVTALQGGNGKTSGRTL